MSAAGEFIANGSAQPRRSAHVRTLHLYSGNLYGGVETFLRMVGRQMLRVPDTTTEFALCFEGRLATELRAAGIPVHMLGQVRVRAPASIAKARGALASLLRSTRYDVVVCHSVWPHALFAPVVRAAGLPLVHFMHDVPNRRVWLDQWAHRTRPDLVLCNSAYTMSAGAWIFAGAPRRQMTPWIDVDRFGGGRGSRGAVRASLGAGDGTVVILQASRLQESKGHRLLVEALGQMRDDPRWACWITGKAQRELEIAYERDLRARVAELGLGERVRFVGMVDDLPALMAAADVFCQPNASPEPFGSVFVEALAASLPVVTTRMGGALEIVTDACGILAEPTPASVAAGLSRLVGDVDVRGRLSAAGPARAREIGDPTTRVRQLAAVFASVVPARAPSDPLSPVARAALSEGRSGAPILAAVARVLGGGDRRYECLVDLGCGGGDAARGLAGLYRRYVGCDVVRYDGFPESESVRFQRTDLNVPPYPVESASADVVLSVETIEHVENPRALVREMARIVRPGGRLVVTTPNQLSLASKASLVLRNQFLAFQEAPGLYPAHITALVELDLRRIAGECGLVDVEVHYTDHGRVPFTSGHWPRGLGLKGRAFSDNVLLVARRP